MKDRKPGLEETLLRVAEVPFQWRVLETTRRLYDIERPFGFDAFERSARFCTETLREAGADDVEMMDFPADGRADYWDKRLPLAWYPESARLEVVSPKGALPDPVIADRGRSPFHLAMWSAATPPGGVVTELVTENMMREGHSVEGKLVLANPYRFPKAIYREVCDRGGIGIVADFVKDPFVTPDGLFWVNSFQESPEWFHGADNRDLLGLCITPRVGLRLRELLVDGTVKVRAEVKARKEPGTLYAATGTLRGSELPEEELWLAAHLFEPLGTDNSTGAAAAMTALRVLIDLVRKGELPPPRRTIRVVMTLELYGFTAVLKTLMERGKSLAAAFVMDGVTFRQSVSGLPAGLYMSPDANPLFSERPVRRAVDLCLRSSSRTWRRLNASTVPQPPFAYEFLPGYFGNDAFLGDPMVGGPSFHFHTPGGPYWHNSENDFGKVWPELLNAMTALHAGLPHYLCSLGPADAETLGQQVEDEGRLYLREGMQQAAERPGEAARAVAFRREKVLKRFADLSRWAGSDFDEEAARLKAFSEDLLAEVGLTDADGESDELSDTDRRASELVFSRTRPTFPMSQAFVEKPGDRRELDTTLDNVLARMDGRKDLLRVLREEEYFRGRPLNRERLLADCLFLAEHGYLEVLEPADGA